MVYSYIRFSTSSQDDMQQQQAIREWAQTKGIHVDEFVKDEGISGGVSYKDRNLYKLVRKLKAGDVLICSELSRLGRAMGDISSLLNDELKHRKIRLIVIKSGIDIDCSNMKAPDEFIFSALSFAAQVEKELIQSRTKSSLDARKEEIRINGGFMSKNGNWIRKLGRAKGCDTSSASAISARNAQMRAEKWKSASPLYLWVEKQLIKRVPRREIVAEAVARYEEDPSVWCTRGGRPLSEAILCGWIKDMKL